MKVIAGALLALEVLFITSRAVRIVQGNDDGWAELYTRSFNDALRSSGHDVVLSAPAENQSGTGSSQKKPSKRRHACQYHSCPAHSGATGCNSTRPDLNWVNSYPATAIKYGIEKFGPDLWGGNSPELAVSGPNVGSNLGAPVRQSGTVGAAVYAAHKAHIPALAFSAPDAPRAPWDTRPVPNRSVVYGDVAAAVTQEIIKSGKPYLPEDTFLNINLPKYGSGCNATSDFVFVLSRISKANSSREDVEWCKTKQLPWEKHVVHRSKCSASISIGDASNKSHMNDVAKQKAVLDKLRRILTCFHDDGSYATITQYTSPDGQQQQMSNL